MRTLPAMWAVVIAAALLGLAVAGTRAAGARRRASGEAERYHTVQDLAAQLAAVQASARDLPARPRPRSSLAAELSAALEAAGLAPETLAGLSSESLDTGPNAGERNTGLRHRRASITLVSLTLPQLGAFLTTWRGREPAWTITGIDVGPEAGATPEPGQDMPLRALLRLEALYVDAGHDRGGTP